jgi:hypothetical protein
MCPVCIASSTLLAAGVVSAGGLTALATRLVRLHQRAKSILTEKAKGKEKRSWQLR